MAVLALGSPVWAQSSDNACASGCTCQGGRAGRAADIVAAVREDPGAVIKKSADAVRRKTDIVPEALIILGSGLGDIADMLENKVEIPYKDIPGFVISTAEGHAGKLVLGRLEGHNVAVMQGRVHCYEGYNVRNVAYPVQVLHELGAKTLIVTNSSGAISQGHYMGEIILIKDHINFLGVNPLAGRFNAKLGPRFFDMSTAYTPELREAAKKHAAEMNIELTEGVYAAMSGPSYETPAERKMLRIVGADAVGMSTVPEVIAGVGCGMKVLGFSCITDVPADIPLLENQKAAKTGATTHEEVLQAAHQAEKNIGLLIRAAVKDL